MSAEITTAQPRDSVGTLLRRVLRYTKPYWHLVMVTLLMALIFAGGRFGRAYLMKPLIDDVLLPAQVVNSGAGDVANLLAPTLPGAQSGVPNAQSGVPGPDRDAPEPEAPRAAPSEAAQRQVLEDRMRSPEAFKQIILAAVAIILIMPLALFGRSYTSAWMLGRIHMDIQRELVAKLLAVPLSFHRKGRSGDLLSRALNDVTQFKGVLQMVLDEFALAIVMVVVGAGMLLSISWQLALLSFVTAPLIVGVLAFFSSRIRRGARKRQKQHGEVAQRLTSILSGIKVIKAFRGEDVETLAFANETRRLFRRTMKVVTNRIASRSLIEVLNNGTGIAMFVIGAWLVIHGYWGLTTGDIAAFATVTATTYKPTKALSKGWAQLVDALASAERYFEVIDAPEEPADVPGCVDIQGIQDGIRFDRVSYSYGREPVLENVSLDVSRGEVIAIVGPTGGGKTTLMDLLLRFQDVDSGAIEIDGVNLRNISRQSLLSHISVVTQEPFLFDTTIWENIRYGRPETSDEEVRAAARSAHVDEFVEQLPEGYETQVGEFGLHLSGGQRQRITIARAILKRPSLLVFDEATSALDAKTERTVQEAINTLRGSQTVFLVAHRLSTIRAADRIVVVEAGKVTQVGSHDELMAREGGLYRELVSLQLESADA